MRRSNGLQYLVQRLPAQNFSGLVGDTASPLIQFTSEFWSGWHLPIELFYFTKCIVQHLGYFLLLDYQPCPIWTVSQGLRSFLEGPTSTFGVWCFWRRIQSCQITWLQFLRDLYLRFYPELLSILSIVAGFLSSFNCTVLSAVYYLVQRLPAQNFSGLVGDTASPLIQFTSEFWSGWHLPIELFYFTKCIVQHLGYFLLLDYQPCPIWTVSQGLRSFLEGPTSTFGVWCFWRRIQSCQITWLQFLRDLYLRFYPELLSILSIVAGFLSSFNCTVLSAVYWIYLFKKGLQSDWRDWFVIASDVLGSILPDFYYLSPLMKKVLTGCLPFCLMGFLE